MSNSMDGILVKYGTNLTKEEQDLLWYAPDEKSQKRQAELKRKIKITTVPDFLALPKENLSELEQKIQQALRLVYELNEKEPPLYQRFPTFRSKTNPLTIDITTAGNSVENCSAAYDMPDNLILFKQTKNPNNLVLSIAHELKHAEQADQEIYELHQYSPDNYLKQQIDFLSEAQAYATGGRAIYEIFKDTKIQTKLCQETCLYAQISQQHTSSTGQKDYQKIEQEMIKKLLDKLFTSEHYKGQYDKRSPIRQSDKGLTHIPDVFHLPQNLIETLKKVPREALTLDSKLLQAENDDHVDKYISLIREAIHTHQAISPSLKFISQKGSIQQVQQALAMKQEDQYVFDDEQIRYLFDDLAQEETPSPLIKHLLNIKRNGKHTINENTLIDVLKWKKTPEELQSFLKIIQDEQGLIPLTEKECITKQDTNAILDGYSIYTEKALNNLIRLLPNLLKLKGRDGKLLINEKHLAKRLNSWCTPSKNPQYFCILCNALKNPKGCLPLSRKALYIQDPQNQKVNEQNVFLYSLPAHNSSYEKYSLSILPFIMSLKDKEGKPIISPQDIQRFPKNHKLATAIKAYAQKRKKQTKLKKILTEHAEQPFTSKVKQFVVRLWNRPR